jgi:hypothetical protein
MHRVFWSIIFKIQGIANRCEKAFAGYANWWSNLRFLLSKVLRCSLARSVNRRQSLMRSSTATPAHNGICPAQPAWGRRADRLAVVDSEAKVHGLSGLRVVDASIMPFVTNGNTNAPTIMLAEKLSDTILGACPPCTYGLAGLEEPKSQTSRNVNLCGGSPFLGPSFLGKRKFFVE